MLRILGGAGAWYAINMPLANGLGSCRGFRVVEGGIRCGGLSIKEVMAVAVNAPGDGQGF